MPEYPPYVNAYGSISKLFQAIKAAAVPPKFTQDFLSTVLGLKSTSYRAMIPLLKRLGFLDGANVPTQAYKDYREDSLSGGVMAGRLREAYSSLFQAHEYANKLDKTGLTEKLKSITGAAGDDSTLSAVVGTFMALSSLAAWDAPVRKMKEDPPPPIETKVTTKEALKGGQAGGFLDGRLSLSYTINLNLPATTEIDVFNAIFKSLRDNLLKEGQ